jgi:2-polyprenyl-6-methoxyphenol hydroxylase-like FAD-dependent oxidoreductase
MNKSVAIIGGGPSAYLLAAFIDATQFDITIYEKKNLTAFMKLPLIFTFYVVFAHIPLEL